MNWSSWLFVSNFLEVFYSVLAGVALFFVIHVCVETHDEIRAIRKAVEVMNEILADGTAVINKSKRPRRNPKRQSLSAEPVGASPLDSGGT